MLSTPAAKVVSCASRGTIRVIRRGASGAASRDSYPFGSLWLSLSPPYGNVVKQMLYARQYGASQSQLSWMFTVGLLRQDCGSTELVLVTQTLASWRLTGTMRQHASLYQSAKTHR